jgi:hypothetical protein
MGNNNVKIGRGLSDTVAYHRALEVARQLEAADLWDGQGLIAIHETYDIHRQVQSTPVEKLFGTTNVRAGIHDRIQGQDYELSARPA